MAEDCLFCRIVSGDEPAEMVREENEAVVFEDKFPVAPVHVLVTPREHIGSAHELTDEHADLLATCFRLAREVAEEEDTADGYRIATNVGGRGGQSIDHLHFHVVGGRQLGHVDSEA